MGYEYTTGKDITSPFLHKRRDDKEYQVPVVALDPDTINLLNSGEQVSEPGNPASGAVATSQTAPAAVAVSDEAASILASNANRLRVVFRNTGTVLVGLGPAGITLANASIVMLPGSMWVEKDFAHGQWYAVTEEDKASTVAIHALIK